MIRIARHGDIADFGKEKNEFSSPETAVRFLDKHLRTIEKANADLHLPPTATRAGWHLIDTEGELELYVDPSSGRISEEKKDQEQANELAAERQATHEARAQRDRAAAERAAATGAAVSRQATPSSSSRASTKTPATDDDNDDDTPRGGKKRS